MRGILLGLMLPTLISVAEAGSGGHRVWIETAVDHGRLLAVPQIKAGHAALVDYELISTKSGQAGSATTNQSGSAQLAQGESRSFTRLRLSVGKHDQYTLLLRVYEQGELVAEDSVTYP